MLAEFGYPMLDSLHQCHTNKLIIFKQEAKFSKILLHPAICSAMDSMLRREINIASIVRKVTKKEKARLSSINQIVKD